VIKASLGFMAYALGFGVWGLGFAVWFGVWGLGIGVVGFGFWVGGFGGKVWFRQTGAHINEGCPVMQNEEGFPWTPNVHEYLPSK